MDIDRSDIMTGALGACGLRPEDLGPAAGKFGNAAVDHAADLLVSFFKEKGYWSRFGLSDLMRFAEKNGKVSPNAILVGLMGYWTDNWIDIPVCVIREMPPYIVMDVGGGMFVTRFFANKLAAPVVAGAVAR